MYTLSSYSEETKPAVAALNNTVCVIFKPSSTSALREKNFYYSGSWSAHSDFQVNNTTSNSSNPSIASDVQKYFLAYQNGTTEIKYLEFFRGVDNVLFTYEESIITTGSPYTNNIEPSISSHEGDPFISWSGYSSGIPTAIVKRRVSGTWSNFNSFGSGTVRNTNSSSRDAGTDGSIVAWCNIYNEHKCVKLLNGIFSSITTIPETGGNGQIQLSNGYDFNNIKSVILKQPLSSIYEVKPLPFNFSTLLKENGNVLRYYGRMAINQKQEKTFVYYLGNILLDGKSIMFKHFQDTANIKTDDNMTEIMATENIYLRPNSSLQLSTSYYVIDRDNTKKLVNGDEIKFSVELVDANSKEVRTSFDEAKYDSKSSPEKKSSYTLNLKNINEGNYFLRISTKTNGGGEFYYCDVQDEETSTLKKEEQIELEFNNNNKIPTGYELLQNYPNPFNPTTTINYQLPENGFVTIKVYDMLGKEIATLVNGNKTAGYHNVTFDAGRLTSGIYFYTIRSGDYFQVKKMLLIK